VKKRVSNNPPTEAAYDRKITTDEGVRMVERTEVGVRVGCDRVDRGGKRWTAASPTKKKKPTREKGRGGEWERTQGTKKEGCVRNMVGREGGGEKCWEKLKRRRQVRTRQEKKKRKGG